MEWYSDVIDRGWPGLINQVHEGSWDGRDFAGESMDSGVRRWGLFVGVGGDPRIDLLFVCEFVQLRVEP